MADITNAEAIAFCDQKLRVCADAMLTAYRTAEALADYWHANSISSLIDNDAADDVKDGANPVSGAADGRQPLTGAAVHNLVTRAGELSSADLTLTAEPLWGAFALNTILQVAVNGNARF